MQKLIMNLLLFGCGMLLYAIVIFYSKPVFESILLAELGSFALGFSSISMLHSMGSKK